MASSLLPEDSPDHNYDCDTDAESSYNGGQTTDSEPLSRDNSTVDTWPIERTTSQDNTLNKLDSSMSKGSEERKGSQESEADEEFSCPICLEDMIHPVRLPCTHVFCFLCVKGVTITNGHLCPLCRATIAANFLTQPTLLTPPVGPSKSSGSGRRLRSNNSSTSSTTAGDKASEYQWFYEGNNGWWRYDARTNTELEEAYTAGLATLTLLLAGHNFTIDLKHMHQIRADGGGMLRTIKRDSPNSMAKGTAGLYTKTLLSAGSKTKKKVAPKRKRND